MLPGSVISISNGEEPYRRPAVARLMVAPGMSSRMLKPDNELSPSQRYRRKRLLESGAVLQDRRGRHSNHARGEAHPRWRGGHPTPNPARRRANAYASKRRYPERHRAREILNQAVRMGRFPKASDYPCVDCGQPAKRYDHHEGYGKPFSVQPVCYKCDGQRSRARGEHKLHGRKRVMPRFPARPGG